jgi:signal transduction histidine kinase
METPMIESLTRLRHDLRTPVNHILGYTELLIEDAAEHRLESLLPSLHGIQSGGRQLLETIDAELASDAELGGQTSVEVDWDLFRQHLGSRASEVLGICHALIEKLANGDQQTRADADAISRALHRLVEFSVDGVLPVNERRPS